MRILAVDYGRARLGLALSDATASIAMPLKTLNVKHPRAAIPDFKAMVAEHNVQVIVVGLPLDQDGGEGEIAKEVKAWATTLGRAVPAEIVLRDERFTSQWADRIIELKTPGAARRLARDQRDAMAAETILQSYLDERKHQQADQ